MFEVKTCSQEAYDFLRMMGRHRKSLTLSVLRAIDEEGWIEWEDHSYSRLSDAGELLHPTFGFLKRMLPELKVSFSDYFAEHPVQKPYTSLWDGIGKTSSGTIILLKVKTEQDAKEAERLNAVAYLVGKGMPVKYVDLILINDSFLNDGYEQVESKWKQVLAERNKNLSAYSHMYSCCMPLTGSLDPEESV